MGEIKDAALSMVGPVAGAAMGLMLKQGDQHTQLQQQQQLIHQQSNAQKDLTAYNQQMAMKMWEDTNYSAQIEQMKKAGVNPALLYGMGGGGGTTAQVTQGSVNGGTAAQAGNSAQYAGMGMQLALLGAQKANIDANTEKTKTETAKIGGVDTELAKVHIGSLTQGIENQKAQEILTKVQSRIANLDEILKAKTLDDAAMIIEYTADKAFIEVNMLARQNEIDAATKETKINLIKTELTQKLLQNELIKATTTTEKGKPALQAQEIKYSEAQITNMAKVLVQRYTEIEDKHKEIDLKEREAMWEQQSREDGIPMRIIETIGQAIIFKNIINPSGANEIKGFKRK